MRMDGLPVVSGGGVAHLFEGLDGQPGMDEIVAIGAVFPSFEDEDCAGNGVVAAVVRYPGGVEQSEILESFVSYPIRKSAWSEGW